MGLIWCEMLSASRIASRTTWIVFAGDSAFPLGSTNDAILEVEGSNRAHVGYRNKGVPGTFVADAAILQGSQMIEPFSIDGSLIDQDPANAGIRREPELPAHEAIAREDLAPAAEFALLDEEPDGEHVRAVIRNQRRAIARQAALDPADSLGL